MRRGERKGVFKGTPALGRAGQELALRSHWGILHVYGGSHPAPTWAPSGWAALSQRSGYWHMPASGPAW